MDPTWVIDVLWAVAFGGWALVVKKAADTLNDMKTSINAIRGEEKELNTNMLKLDKTLTSLIAVLNARGVIQPGDIES